MLLEDFNHYQTVHDEAKGLVEGMARAKRLKQWDKAQEYVARIIAFDYEGRMLRRIGDKHTKGYGKRGPKVTRRKTAIGVLLALSLLALTGHADNDAVCRSKTLPMNSLVTDLGVPVRWPFVDPDGDELSVVFHRDAERFAVEQSEPNQLTVVYRSDVPGTYYMDITVKDDNGASKDACVEFRTYYQADYNRDDKVNLKDFEQFSKEWSMLRRNN